MLSLKLKQNLRNCILYCMVFDAVGDRNILRHCLIYNQSLVHNEDFFINVKV